MPNSFGDVVRRDRFTKSVPAADPAAYNGRKFGIYGPHDSGGLRLLASFRSLADLRTHYLSLPYGLNRADLRMFVILNANELGEQTPWLSQEGVKFLIKREVIREIEPRDLGI
jgi:hypothetical protein